MSVRAVAKEYGIPARTVARAVQTGDLAALRTITETGRERAYIRSADAAAWAESLVVTTKTVEA
jgi:hypothetical protein